MRTRATAIFTTVVLVVYLAVFGWLAVMMLWGGTLEAVGFGVALVLLIVVGAWIAVANLWFGVRVERLARRLAGEGGLPDTSALPRRPSGRVAPGAADAWYERCKAELDREPADWRRWYRLADAYDQAGDRRRARESMRQALRLSATDGDGSRATSAEPGSVTRPAE
jgi:cytochrome c-type biogenesis protein CcmH/NrfG